MFSNSNLFAAKMCPAEVCQKDKYWGISMRYVLFGHYKTIWWIFILKIFFILVLKREKWINYFFFLVFLTAMWPPSRWKVHCFTFWVCLPLKAVLVLIGPESTKKNVNSDCLFWGETLPLKRNFKLKVCIKIDLYEIFEKIDYWYKLW